MISFLSGKIIQKNINSIVVMTSGGVGYEIIMGRVEMNEENNISLYTYLKVSDSAMVLYGFKTKEEKIFFELLISVKGIGPKGALNILGLGSIDEIQNAIGRADITYLTQVSGLGKRTAERLCVELKNKVGGHIEDMSSNISNVLGEVVEGLMTMGYSKEEVREVVKQLDSDGKSIEELLKQALKYLSCNI